MTSRNRRNPRPRPTMMMLRRRLRLALPSRLGLVPRARLVCWALLSVSWHLCSKHVPASL